MYKIHSWEYSWKFKKKSVKEKNYVLCVVLGNMYRTFPLLIHGHNREI